MRQRVAIAIAFINKPDLIIADEPTTALDVTIQAQILAEAQALCARTGTAMIWITHDLAVVSSLADRIAVMYAGRIVETGRTADVVNDPQAPLHERPDRFGAEPQRARPAAGADPRHDAVADQPAAGMRLPHALFAGDRRVPAGAADARAGARARRALFQSGRLSRARGRGGCVMIEAPLVSARGLSKRFVKRPDLAGRIAGHLGADVREETVHAVDGVDLDIGKGEVVGLVGEVRLRQIDARTHDRRPADADRRRGPVQGQAARGRARPLKRTPLASRSR